MTKRGLTDEQIDAILFQDNFSDSEDDLDVLNGEYIVEPKTSVYFKLHSIHSLQFIRMPYTQSAVSLCTHPCVGMHSECACVVSLWQRGVLQTMLSYTDVLMVSDMNGNCFIYIDVYIFMAFILH